MNKLGELLKWLISYQTKITPKVDKLAHFFWGFWYTLLGVIMDVIFNTNYFLLVIPIMLGGYKELRDLLSKEGSPEWMDFIYTILPSAIFYIFL